MTTAAPTRWRRLGVRTLSATAVALLAASALAACGSGKGSSSSSTASAASTSTSTPTTASSSAPSTGGTDALAATVASQSKPLSSYPVPTQALTNVSSLKGKTVYYIPITQQAPQFAVTGAALTTALGAVGIKVQICNGNSNPSSIAACITQATGAKAGAIIADSIPYVLSANAFAAARAKGIPVLITDQIADATFPANATLGYLEGGGAAQLKAVADWIIVDSKGKAKVVINESTDSPSTQAYVAAAQAEFTKNCTGCTVAINKISSANFSLIASSTSSKILKTPGANYVLSEFDQYLQPTVGGVQQSGKLASVKGASTAAQLSGLQMLKSKNFLYVDAGQASAYQGWASADAALRLMLKQTLPAYTIPIRLFTRDNVSSIKATAAAQATGEWFGPASFTTKFKTLWGAS